MQFHLGLPTDNVKAAVQDAEVVFPMIQGFPIPYVEAEDISALAGLNQRSPLLATSLTLAMVSLAGIPPLAGFFGKFLLFKSAIEQGPSYYWLVAQLRRKQ